MRKRILQILPLLLVVGVIFALLYAVLPNRQELSQERAIAERRPLLGIAGVEPELLRKHVQGLELVAHKLAALQTNAYDARLIETSLFPTRFLASLADLEDARRRFIRSGSLLDGLWYDVRLRMALQLGMQDATRFRSGLELVLRNKNPIQVAGLSGVMTNESLLRAAHAAETHMRENAYTYKSRMRCIQGDKNFCGTRTSLGDRLAADTVDLPADANPALLADIRSLQFVGDNIKVLHKQEVVLSSSVCARALPAPYHFLYLLLQSKRDIEPRSRFILINDLFFYPTDRGNGKTLQYLRNNLAISYSLINPMAFYMCPNVLRDTSRIQAVMFAADVARTHPTLAPQERAIFLSSPSVLLESHARRYIAAALEEGGNDPDVLVAARMFLEQSAGLVDLIQHMEYLFQESFILAKDNVPTDLNAEVLFRTESAFSSFFMVGESRVGKADIEPFLASTTLAPAVEKQYVHYSELRRTLSKESIMQNVRELVQFHATQ